MDLTTLRGDGRRGLEVRRVESAFGVVEDCDGSALLNLGLTKVLVTINGPREVAMKQDAIVDKAVVKCQVSQAAFSTTERRRRRAGDKRATTIAHFVENTFSNVIQTELFPQSQIDITIHILQADGSVLPACISATSLALTHAGVPMLDFVSCCSIGHLDGQMALDLTHSEETSGGPQLCVTLMPRSSQLLTVKMDSTASRVTGALLDQMMTEAQIGCHQISKILMAKVRESVVHALEERKDRHDNTT
mmetsp:Transcript_8310/g.14714  ORF Transcript_8310/g.14714 Transcript_8310/m.14714 type:complete len:248 (+) Transcript_8310:102-845(+)